MQMRRAPALRPLDVGCLQPGPVRRRGKVELLEKLDEFSGGGGGARGPGPGQVSGALVRAAGRTEEKRAATQEMEPQFCFHILESRVPPPSSPALDGGTTPPSRLRGDQLRTEWNVCHEACWDW